MTISKIAKSFNSRKIDLETTLEELTKLGFCPVLINDDNGHWALLFDGTQTVPQGEEPEAISTNFLGEKEHWKNSISDAVRYALTQLK